MIYHLYIGKGNHPAEHVFNGSKERCIELALRWIEKMGFEAEMTWASDQSVIWDVYNRGMKFVPAYIIPELPNNDEERFDYMLKHTTAPKHKR